MFLDWAATCRGRAGLLGRIGIEVGGLVGGRFVGLQAVEALLDFGQQPERFVPCVRYRGIRGLGRRAGSEDEDPRA